MVRGKLKNAKARLSQRFHITFIYPCKCLRRDLGHPILCSREAPIPISPKFYLRRLAIACHESSTHYRAIVPVRPFISKKATSSNDIAGFEAALALVEEGIASAIRGISNRVFVSKHVPNTTFSCRRLLGQLRATKVTERPHEWWPSV